MLTTQEKAVVIFDRAQKKFGVPTCVPLAAAPGLTQAKKRLGIVTIDAGISTGP